MVDTDIESVIRRYDSNKKTADVTIEVVRLLSGMSRCEVSVVLAAVHMGNNKPVSSILRNVRGCRKLKAQEVIDFIKNERIRKGLSKSRLAKESGLSRELIGKFELGKYSPKLSTIEKIGKALDLEIVIRRR